MPPAVDNARRELVKLLRSLAQRYKLRLELSRDSSAKEVTKAFKSVSLRAHPDKGGEQADFQRLGAANDARQELLKGRGSVGRLAAAARTLRREIPFCCHALAFCALMEDGALVVRSQFVLAKRTSSSNCRVLYACA